MKVLRYLPLMAALLSGPAMGQSNCAPRANIVEQLASQFGETRQSMGLGAGNVLVEVYASDQTGTWTITMTNPRGVTCLMAAGQAFETLVESLPASGSKL